MEKGAPTREAPADPQPPVLDYRKYDKPESPPVATTHGVVGVLAFFTVLIPAMLHDRAVPGPARWIVIAFPLASFARRKARRMSGAPKGEHRETGERLFRYAIWALTVLLALSTFVSVGCSTHGWSYGVLGIGINHSTGGGPCNLPYYGAVDYWYITDQWCVWSAW